MRLVRSFVPLAACMALTASSCGGEGPGSAPSTAHRPFDPSLQESTQAGCTRGSGPDVTYCNGPLEPIAQIIPILWGSNVDAAVQGDIMSTLASHFATDFEGDSALSWLGGDYNPSLLNFSSAGGSGVITINPSNRSTSIFPADITTELTRQFSLSPSPIPQPPEVGWSGPIYVIHFPPGITLKDPKGPATSCGTFTGYHSVGNYNNVSYAFVAVGPCFVGNLPKYERLLSHEIAETMTDADQANGWCGSDCANHEIGDVCGNQAGAVTAVNEEGEPSHAIQALWSNSISDSKPTGTEAPNSVYTVGSVGNMSTPTAPQVSACFAEKTVETRMETGQSTFASNQTFLADHFQGFPVDYDVAKVYSDSSGNIGLEVHKSGIVAGGLKASDWTGPAGSQGAFAPDMAFMSGNFDGDDMADIADAWNNGGCIALDVHKNIDATHFQLFSQAGRGDCFSHGIWSDRWYWVAGDFNGDGLTDIATIWSLGAVTNNQEVIDLHLATGNLGFATGFTDVPSAASNQGPIASDGHPLTGEHWFAGDVNGDGKTDLIKVYNQGGRTLINMSINNGQCAASSTSCSTTNAFSLAGAFGGLLNPTGKFYPNGQWMAGDFDANGTIDVAQAFPDPATGNIDIDVELSTGGSTLFPGIVTFYPQRWTMRQGAWSASQKWFVGDFGGDGHLDFAKASQDIVLGGGHLAIDAHIQM
ncbi:MAG TPA: hypothetical protein VKU41_23860 [Polyangiaceae bacterium]|nr:hypothetical protein [Polyangiaceae bacterium]